MLSSCLVIYHSYAMSEEVKQLETKVKELQNLVAQMQILGQGNPQRVFQTATQIPIPEKFSFLPEDWLPWYEHYERYRGAMKLVDQSEGTQKNDLLLLMGPNVSKIFERIQKKETEFTTYRELVEALRKYFEKKINVVYERAKFNRREQKEGEPANDYISIIISMAKSCKYGQLEDELIRDRLIVGIRDHKLSESLQMDETLNLERTVEKITQAEAVKNQNKELRKQSEVGNIDRVEKGHQSEKKNREYNKARNASVKTKYPECFRCGSKPSHPWSECPARNIVCHKCSKRGHFKKFCKTTRIAEVQELSSSSEDVSCGEIRMVNKIGMVEAWTVTLNINGVNVVFKVDTGADATVLSKKSFEEMKCLKRIRNTTVKLMGPGKNILKTLGKITLPTIYNKKKENLKMYVVDTTDNLLGRPALVKLGVLNWQNEVGQMNNSVNEVMQEISNNDFRQKIVSEYKKVFEGLGQITDFEYDLKINKNSDAYTTTVPRRVPLPLMEEVRKELHKMVESGVIKQVEEPTDWCFPMVIAKKKSGKIRVCTDFTQLNKNVKRELYQLPSVEETLGKIRDGKIFTKLDCSSGFYQIRLSDRSVKYTTFITPFGRFAYLRCPFGLSSAPEVFQKVLSQIIDSCGLDTVNVHADDIIITGRDIKEHDRNVKIVLKKLKDSGVTLNLDKCEFRKTEIKYLGYIVSDKGIKPDPDNVEAIVNYPQPTSVSEVRQFLGMITYITKFIKDYSSLIQPLRELLQKNKTFLWGPYQQKCFDKLKLLITTTPVLAAYNVNYATRVSTDSSAYGVGGVLEQRQEDGTWRPVSYCSKSLSTAEQRYAQVEKECLAIVFTCNRLNQFLIGKKFEIRTDHKPLVEILTSKPINNLSARLQIFRMKLVLYDYTVAYIPGKELSAPDALSRAPLKTGLEDGEVLQGPIRTIANITVDYITEENENDIFKVLRKYTTCGWPEKNKCDRRTLPYYNYRNDISIIDGLLTYQDRLIIPEGQRKKSLKNIHMGHLGVNKSKSRAKTAVWWPGIGSQIEDMVNNCEQCIKANSNRAEPMMPFDVPALPWMSVGTDLLEIKGEKYLLVQDYYSKFMEVVKLERTESKFIVDELKIIFGRFGIPREVHSDNGPQYNSHVFREFARTYNFRWVSSSPTYAKANGLAESGVKTVKRIIKNSDDWNLGLLAYRNTALSCGASPSELLMGRSLRDTLPLQDRKLKPKLIDHDRVRQKMKEAKEKQKKNYDQRHGARNRANLEKGDRVWIRNRNMEGVVQSPAGFRSYVVETEDGGMIRRNKEHLSKLPKKGIEQQLESTREQPVDVEVGREVAEQSDEERRSAAQRNKQEHPSVVRRSTRTKTRPAHLDDYTS